MRTASKPTVSDGERGVTLLELVVAMAGMMIVVGGALLFVVFQVEQNVVSFDRAGIQHGGRSALNMLSQEIGMTGLGIPRRLAYKSFGADPLCNNSTRALEIAYLDFLREWQVAGTSASAITLASPPDPVPGDPPDVAIAAGRWLFIFGSSKFEEGTPDQGHGMVQVTADRGAGSASLTIGNVTYSATQPTLGLGGLMFQSNATVLLLKTSKFGVDCTSNPTRPFLYWERDGKSFPLASNVDVDPLTAVDAGIDGAPGDIVGIRFRFLVDDNNDGRPDDQNGDSVIDNRDLVTTPANIENTIAIEALVRLRAQTPNGNTGKYQVKSYVQLIRTPNVHTSPENRPFQFVHNNGLGS